MTTEEIAKWKELHESSKKKYQAWRFTHKERTERAVAMVKLRYEEGLSLQAIATRFGLTRERVRQIIEAFMKSA